MNLGNEATTSINHYRRFGVEFLTKGGGYVGSTIVIPSISSGIDSILSNNNGVGRIFLKPLESGQKPRFELLNACRIR